MWLGREIVVAGLVGKTTNPALKQNNAATVLISAIIVLSLKSIAEGRRIFLQN